MSTSEHGPPPPTRSGAAERAVRLLIVEDSDDDARLIAHALAEAGRKPILRRVDDAESMSTALLEVDWDVVISDHAMRRFSSSEALALLKRSGRDIPFIIYSGAISRESESSAIREGASDCIRKGKVDRLVPAIQRELRNAASRRKRGAAPSPLSQLSDYDRLTALSGRKLFMEQAAELLAGRREHLRAAACLIDLSQFVRVNKAFGYDIGDQVLVQVAQRLKSGRDSRYALSRFGGDEFAVFHAGFFSLQQARAFASELINKLERPYHHKGLEIHLASSMGVAVSPEGGLTLPELMLNAETALYQCKRLLGRNSFILYFEELEQDGGDQLGLEPALRHALRRNELRLRYQPRVDVAAGRVPALKVTMHWQHPELGLLGPERFVALAEDTGLIGELGEWVLTKACRQAHAREEGGLSGLALALSLSPAQFSHPQLVGRIARLLRDSTFDPRFLEFEISESALMRDVDSTISCLTALKRMGTTIAVDEFGAGHSSLSCLKRLPFDRVNIAASLVRNIESDVRDAAAARTAIDLARNFGVAALADGVQTQGQFDFLHAYGCNLIQGPYCSAPLLPAQIPAALERLEARFGAAGMPRKG